MFEVTWFGQSFCYIRTPDGLRIAMDPFCQGLGYDLPNVEADVVTVSHDHSDHNNVEAIKGNPIIIKELKENKIKNTIFKGVFSYHDKNEGKLRGNNIIWVIMDKLNIVHTGDLGANLNEEQLDEIGKVDILLLTVGGIFTIGPEEASRLMWQTRAKITIPVHYLAPGEQVPLAPVYEFIRGKDKSNVDVVNANTVLIDENNLPDEPWIIIPNYKTDVESSSFKTCWKPPY